MNLFKVKEKMRELYVEINNFEEGIRKVQGSFCEVMTTLREYEKKLYNDKPKKWF